MQLTGKVAVVTGAGRGIGLAITEALAAEGVKVVAGSRSTTPELARLDGVIPQEVDLTDPAGPARLIERAINAHGGVDILVNNVGGLTVRLGGFLTLTDDDWRAALDLNLMTAVRASRAALPSLVERGGRIVNISSINARLPQPQVIDYAVAKAALTSLSKGLAEEYGPDGVRVNTVSPGPVRTPLWEAEGSPGQVMATAMADGDHGGFLAGVPDAFGMTIGRFVEPSEVGALVVLLVSDRSGAVNGSDWVIDGGMLKSY